MTKITENKPQTLGFLIVEGVPGLKENREKLLQLTKKLAGKDDAYLDNLIVPESNNNIGWSYGHATKKGVGKSSFNKASFFANPFHDKTRFINPLTGEEIDIENVWPPGEEFAELKVLFQEQSQIMFEEALKLAKALDKYLESKTIVRNGIKHTIIAPGKSLIENSLKSGKHTLGRLLHYYSSADAKDAKLNEYWCEPHNDLGGITCLASSAFFKQDNDVEDFKDPNCGLYVLDRGRKEHKIKIPPGAIAFQIGEVIQILSGGELVATPHLVRRSITMDNQSLSRDTFVLFVNPDHDFELSKPDCKSEEETTGWHYGKFSALKTRWKPNKKYIDFLNDSLNSRFKK